ncbi:hypothetical protein [Dactylosporangium darangshiense]|uniref:hypothetical protein n=1 Tax=Dactylosporangium darangshiense TaxID=579108 RepID=UPI0031F0DE04
MPTYPEGRDVELSEAVDLRRYHRKEPGTVRCLICHERHPARGSRRKAVIGPTR